MERPDSTRQLQDAAHLLTMLEHLTEGLSQKREGGGREQVPWPGIRLTLGQARDLILATLRNRNERGTERGSEQGARRVEPTQSGYTSLADRVQPAPTGSGRIRDMGPEENGGRSGTRNRPAPIIESSEH